MDFKDAIKQIGDRFEKMKDTLQTEEATKNAIIMPFLQALGYDVFNPMEVLPEFTCDIGTKKGEKIDYAIFKDGKPIILIECKHWKQDLSLHDNQLLRYFHVSNAKFGLLTNGLIYRFYTDIEIPNKMDDKPFLEVNILDIRGNQIEELKKFHKTYFDIDIILSSANELKYMGELRSVLSKEFNDPSPEFVKLLSKKVYEGPITAKLLEQFTSLVKKSISSQISDTISDRLKVALNAESEEKKVEQIEEKNNQEDKDSKIITTEDELEAFYIIKSILRQHFPIGRIGYRDAQSYFTILVDDNNRKNVCRLYMNSSNWAISFTDEKKEVKSPLKSLDDLYTFSDKIIETAKKYL